ncbi:MAG: hypothetical protein JW807_04185 [Spirochaetes bacterium]|nr:hypothetical protein [Spirochaetota bacterium]
MARIRVYLIAAAALLFCCAGVGGALAQDGGEGEAKSARGSVFAMGFKCHYAWWDPVWSESRLTMPLRTSSFQLPGINHNLDMSTRANFLYNPAFSITLAERWSLSGSYMYGEYEYKGNESFMKYFDPDNYFYLVQHKLEVKKHDADLLVNYLIAPWVKFFWGVKYQGYFMHDAINDYMTILDTVGVTLPMKFSDSIIFHSIGLGTGFSFTARLVENFYMLPAISVIALEGRDYSRSDNILKRIVNVFYLGIDTTGSKNYFTLVGGSAALSFAYHIPRAHMTIDAGCRAQFLWYTEAPRKNNRQKYDLFYGPYLGVAFSF